MEKVRQIVKARIDEINNLMDHIIDWEVTHEGDVSKDMQRMNDERFHELLCIKVELCRLLNKLQ